MGVSKQLWSEELRVGFLLSRGRCLGRGVFRISRFDILIWRSSLIFLSLLFWKTARKPREASALIFKIRSCITRTDLKNKAFSADFVPIFKIRSCSVRSDLKNKSARFSGKPPKTQGFFYPQQTLKSLGKKGKTLKKARNSLERKKARNYKKARKGRSGLRFCRRTRTTKGCQDRFHMGLHDLKPKGETERGGTTSPYPSVP